MKRLGTLYGALFSLALAVCLVLLPGAVKAQEQGQELPELSQDWTVHAGLWIPSNSATRSKAGDVGFSGLVERRVYRGLTYDLNVGVGYSGWNDVYDVPVLVDAVGYYNNWRYGGGVSYDFGQRANGRGINAMGFTVLAGYQFNHGSNPITADVSYHWVGGS
ncbi:MAG TPA: hypothetical protein VGS41_02435, partial [Chthonomonadales bacterium]|nr:hypothetical protein [Chthonomonadales bacterium]